MREQGFVRTLVVSALVATSLLVGAGTAEPANGQGTPSICGAAGTGEDRNIALGTPGADGWVNEQEDLAGPAAANRYYFSVKEPSTAQVYVGDQWYNLNLGIFSVASRAEACWTVEARGTSTAAERRVLQFVRPDERAMDLEPGEYILTVRAGDAMGYDPSRKFTVRVAVTPRLCALNPEDQIVEDRGIRLKQKVDNPNKFQVGISFQPSRPDQFSLMSFNAYVSPPYTDLFDFTWELDGQVVPGVVEPTFLRPFADLPKTPNGKHTVKLTARGAREYKDPTEAVYNFVPFDGGAVSVSCTFP